MRQRRPGTRSDPSRARSSRGPWLLHALLPGTDLTIESVNGRAGLAIRRAGTAVAVIAVSCDEDWATTLWVVLNPAKLRGSHRR